MREGPLAELFRATEAAQRQAERDAPVNEPPDKRTMKAAIEEARPRSKPEPTEQPRPRWLRPLPEPGPGLNYVPAPESSSYLAVIRVVGVGGAGLNAIDRMMDAGI
nr:hypothetical protein [Solirubrobacterales bacterium]